jgi:hypothetical protein
LPRRADPPCSTIALARGEEQLVRRAIDHEHVTRELGGPVLLERANEQHRAYAEPRTAAAAFLIEASCRTHRRCAEREYDRRRAGAKNASSSAIARVRPL